MACCDFKLYLKLPVSKTNYDKIVGDRMLAAKADSVKTAGDKTEISTTKNVKESGISYRMDSKPPLT